DLALAGGASAVAAAVGQHDAGRQGGVEHRLAGLDRELMLAGLYGDLETHEYDLVKNARGRYGGRRTSGRTRQSISYSIVFGAPGRPGAMRRPVPAAVLPGDGPIQAGQRAGLS